MDTGHEVLHPLQRPLCIDLQVAGQVRAMTHRRHQHRLLTGTLIGMIRMKAITIIMTECQGMALTHRSIPKMYRVGDPQRLTMTAMSCLGIPHMLLTKIGLTTRDC